MTGFLQRLSAWASLVCVLVAARSARGQSPQAWQWNAPAECPSAASARAAFEHAEHIESIPVARRDRAVRVDIRSRSATRWSAQIAVGNGEALETQDIRGESCIAVTDAVVLLLALYFDPTVLQRVPAAVPVTPPSNSAHETPAEPPPLETSSPANPAVPAPRVIEPQTPAVPTPVRRGDDGLRLGVGLATLVDVGAFPQAAAGFELVGRFRWRALVVRAGVQTFLPTEMLATNWPPVGARIWHLGGVLATCLDPLKTRVSIAGCAGFEFGGNHVSGIHLEVDQPRWVERFAFQFLAELRVALMSRVSLSLRGGMSVPTYAHHYLLGGTAVNLFQPSPVEARGGLAIDVEFEPR